MTVYKLSGEEIQKITFNSLLKRNYESIVKRGLISKKTKQIDFIEKLYEEVQEFDLEVYKADNPDNVSEELADIILVCLNFAKHYNIDILTELYKKIEKNENR